MRSLTLLAGLLGAAAGQLPPVPNPRHPTPLFSWETVPIAFHGANRTGIYNDSAVQELSNYLMVTIEKWYTACGGKHPIQAGPLCNVEKAMYSTFNQLKALKPNITTIMYLNSMFDFSMYHLAGLVQEKEAAGIRILLRDKHDKLVTNFDWSQQAALDLWLSEVANATTVGGVDGIFADHASSMLLPADAPELCNGKGSGRSCWEFTPEFATKFNEGHAWLINHTQNIVTGPVVDGPYSAWHIPACDYEALLPHVQAGQQGVGPYVIEASTGACTPSESCLAGFLMAAQPYTYLTCFADEPTYSQYPSLAKPLGAPLSDAVEGPPGVFTRNFTHGAVVRWYSNRKEGVIQWPGDPPIPPPPAPSPPPPYNPAQCGPMLINTGQGDAEISKTPSSSAAACCELCIQAKGCAIWAWHSEENPATCHLHTDKAITTHDKMGCMSGHLPNHTLTL